MWRSDGLGARRRPDATWCSPPTSRRRNRAARRLANGVFNLIATREYRKLATATTIIGLGQIERQLAKEVRGDHP